MFTNNEGNLNSPNRGECDHGCASNQPCIHVNFFASEGELSNDPRLNQELPKSNLADDFDLESWIDSQLEFLESQFDDFRTKGSLRNYLKR